MQNKEQGVTRYKELIYKAVDSVGQFIVKREKTGKLLTSRDIVLRGGPQALNGRILSGIVGDSLEFPEIGLIYRSSGKPDNKGRKTFIVDKVFAVAKETK